MNCRCYWVQCRCHTITLALILSLLVGNLRSQLSPEERLLQNDELTRQIKGGPALLHRLLQVLFAKRWTLPGRYWNSELSAVQLGEDAWKPKLSMQGRRGISVSTVRLHLHQLWFWMRDLLGSASYRSRWRWKMAGGTSAYFVPLFVWEDMKFKEQENTFSLSRLLGLFDSHRNT